VRGASGAPVVPSARCQGQVDPRPAACRLPAAAVVRWIPATVVGLWLLEASLVRASGSPMVPSARYQEQVDPRPAACRLPAAAGVRRVPATGRGRWVLEEACG